MQCVNPFVLFFSFSSDQLQDRFQWYMHMHGCQSISRNQFPIYGILWSDCTCVAQRIYTGTHNKESTTKVMMALFSVQVKTRFNLWGIAKKQNLNADWRVSCLFPDRTGFSLCSFFVILN